MLALALALALALILTSASASTSASATTPCLKKNVRPLTCYNLDIHGSIMIIFGTSVTEKVGNQNVYYFPTSPNLCFCTTWENRKRENCVFYGRPM